MQLLLEKIAFQGPDFGNRVLACNFTSDLRIKVLRAGARTRAGLEVAKQLGRKGGRKPKMTDSKIESAKKLLASGVPPKDVAKNLGVSIPTLYRWVPASTHA